MVRTRRRLVYEGELKQKYRNAIQLLQSRGREIGDYFEFGVYNGTSLLCMYRVLRELEISGVRLIGFDSFEGLPPIATTDCNGHWRPGEFRSSYEFTTMVLEHEGIDWDKVTLVKGFFDQTLTESTRHTYRVNKVSVIMMDCDLYQSTKEALEFSASHIQDDCVLLFDDWFPLAERNLGEKQAFDEFRVSHPEFAVRELGDFKPWGKIFLVSRTFF